jgi:WD40 repeat protein
MRLLRLLSFFLVVVTAVNGWILASSSSLSRPRRNKLLRRLNNNDNNNDIFYNDFEEDIGGDGKGAPVDASLLQERISRVQTQESDHSESMLQNWQSGNWQVRGFSLEDNDNDDDDDPDYSTDTNHHDSKKVVCCKIVPAHDDEGCIWVGRTDGSVVGVQLGTAFWTKFRSKLTATATEDDAGVRIASAWVRENDDNDDESRPFEIRYQFSASKDPITQLVAYDSYVFTTSSTTGGDIQQWVLPEEGPPRAGARLATTAGETVVCLKRISLVSEQTDVLLSVSHTGSVALWDLQTGASVVQCQATMSNDEPLAITSADSDGTFLYLATTSGHILAYLVRDILLSSSSATSTTTEETEGRLPNGQWKATENGPITAVACAGAAQGMSSSSNSNPSALLLTGDANGVVKQWQVFSVPTTGNDDDSDDASTSRTRLEQWPKRTLQKLPFQKTHVMAGCHEGPVSALLSLTDKCLLSAAADGTIRAWNPVTGKEFFHMDGFSEPIHSLCLTDDNVLVTDGMNKFVCVHDFTIEELDDGSFATDDYLDSL